MRVIELPIKVYDAEESRQLALLRGDEYEPSMDVCRDARVSVDIDQITAVTESYVEDRCHVFAMGESWLVFLPYEKVREAWLGNVKPQEIEAFVPFSRQ